MKHNLEGIIFKVTQNTVAFAVLAMLCTSSNKIHPQRPILNNWITSLTFCGLK